MPSNSDPEWASGWRAHSALDLPARHIALDDAAWITWPGTGLQGRELSLAEASGGRLSGQHVRATGTSAGQGDWHCYDLDFEFVYILQGELTLETLDGSVHPLRRGSAFCHPAFFWHRDLHRSGDLQVVRLTSPAQGNRFDGLDTRLPPRSALLPAARTGVYSHAATLTDPPFTRDLGTIAPTEGRIGIQVAYAGRPGSTDRRRATTAQWLYVVGGTAEIAMEQGPPVRLAPGHSLSVATAPGAANPVFQGATEDFTMLELRTGPAQDDR